MASRVHVAAGGQWVGLYGIYGLISGHFRGRLLPLWPGEILGDALDAARFRLRHDVGNYDAMQRLAYVSVLMFGILAVAAGLALWKPVQLRTLSAAFGGYDIARPAVELRRLFPGITDNAQARDWARTIAGWKPLRTMKRLPGCAGATVRWRAPAARRHGRAGRMPTLKSPCHSRRCQ